MAIQNAYKRIRISLLLLSILFLFTTCIKDDLAEDCRIRIHFDYSYNMFSENHFGEQVDQVTVYVFDEGGTYLQSVTERGTHVLTNDFTMAVPLFNGKYQFVVFAQNNKIQDKTGNFEFPSLQSGQSTLDDLTATLRRTNSVFGGQLNNLLVGYHNTIHIDYVTHSEVVIETKKITNTVRVILADRGQEEINTSSYSMQITDQAGNGIVKYDYTLVPDGTLTYLPYLIEKGTDVNTANQLQPGDQLKRTIVNEFSISQMEQTHEMRLTVARTGTGEKIINANLFALLHALYETDKEFNDDWSFQEYIDREDLFVITLYVDSHTWLDSTVIINGWVINNIHIDF